MSPIRRRTFFGQVNKDDLKRLEREIIFSDNAIRNAEKGYIELTPDLFKENAKAREMGMAAGAELKRRERREKEGRRMRLERNGY